MSEYVINCELIEQGMPLALPTVLQTLDEIVKNSTPLVRCEDCKFFSPANEGDFYGFCDKNNDAIFKYDDFCSKGRFA